MQMKRRPMAKSKSKRTFSRGAKPFNHPVNRNATPQRGGIRL